MGTGFAFATSSVLVTSSCLLLVTSSDALVTSSVLLPKVDGSEFIQPRTPKRYAIDSWESIGVPQF